MGKSNYPNGFTGGVTIRGVPVSVTNPGETFWVNSSSVLPPRGVSPSDNSPGTYVEPVATLGAALDLCKADRGDVIMIMPGYTETVTASDLALDVAGVAIIGMGSGGLKPTFTSSATGSLVSVSAANMSVYNCRFVASVANIVSGISVTAADFSIDSCEFMSEEAADAFTVGIITTVAGEGLSVTNCTFNHESTVAGVAVTDVPTSAIETLGDRSYIAGNSILGEYSTSAIYNQTTAILGATIIDNDVFNVSTSAAAGFISVAAGSTGLIMRNMGMVLETSTIDGLIVNPAMAMSENYAVNVITETGGVVGTPSE
jgi:hypothetical protein